MWWGESGVAENDKLRDYPSYANECLLRMNCALPLATITCTALLEARVLCFCSQVEPHCHARENREIIEGQGPHVWSCGYIYQYGTNYLQQITRITTHADKK